MAPRVGDRLTPLKVARSSADEQTRSDPTDGPLYGLGRYLRLNGFQRAEALVLALLLAGGFGKTSAQVLDPGLAGALQLGAEALVVAHLFIAGFGAFLAAGAEGENPAFWFGKLIVSGVGGFFELTSSMSAKGKA